MDLKKKIKELIDSISDINDLKSLQSEINSPQGRMLIKNNKEIAALNRIVQAILLAGESSCLVYGFEGLIDLDLRIRFFIYRSIYYPYSEKTLLSFLSLIKDGVTVYFFAIYANSLNFESEKCIINISNMYDALDKRKESIILLNFAIKLKLKNNDILEKLIEEYKAYGLMEEAQELIEERKQNNEC